MTKQKGLHTQVGFTLIELLIVIVIIGILAGVLIAIINPGAQQNRAKDAGIKAAMNKIALATEGYISSYGISPNDVQFIGSLQNVTDSGATCAAGGVDIDCLFTVTGNALPSTCAANGWTGPSAESPCAFHYVGTIAGATQTNFTLYAKSFGIVNTVFTYKNFGAGAGQIQHCTDAATPVCPL